MRFPANHDEIAGEVAQQNVVLDLRVLCGTSHAEAHVPVHGSVKRVPCGLSGRLPDTHSTAAVFSGATVDMPEIRDSFFGCLEIKFEIGTTVSKMDKKYTVL